MDLAIRERSHNVLELMLYNMRHVRHHAAQLNMMLRYVVKDAPKRIGRVKDDLPR